MKKAVIVVCMLLLVVACGGNTITGSYLSNNPKVGCIDACIAEGEKMDTCRMKCFGVYSPPEDS